MPLFPANTVSLKICGITSADDATALAELGVHALGANFFPGSKRYLLPENAAKILPPLAGKILRVGVFVNADNDQIVQLVRDNIIDVVQLHGDEAPSDVAFFRDQNIPVIKALAATEENLARALDYRADAILLDTPAGQDYGGTGKTFDWSLAARFRSANPDIPLLLAGGLIPENVDEAISTVHPHAVDVASGAESAPGVKDFDKVKSLLAATQRKD